MRIWHDYGLEGIDNGVAVYGTDGFLHIGRWNRHWGYRHFDKTGKLVTEHEGTEPDFHMRNFVECVISRGRPNCDIEIGHHSRPRSSSLTPSSSCSPCHLGNIVDRTGRNVSFNTTNETIPGDAEALAMLKRKYRNHWATPKGV